MEKLYEPALHFHEVDYSVDEIHILKKITGSFPKGKITTLVGPSGAGKTTLLKLCNGLIIPDFRGYFYSQETNCRHTILLNCGVLSGLRFKVRR